jgi:hypothetical protein
MRYSSTPNGNGPLSLCSPNITFHSMLTETTKESLLLTLLPRPPDRMMVCITGLKSVSEGPSLCYNQLYYTVTCEYDETGNTTSCVRSFS